MNIKIVQLANQILEVNKQTPKLLEKIKVTMEPIKNHDGISDKLENLQKIVIDTNRKIKVVFVGQYSAGKSSIIKLLTGDEHVAIGAGITTQSSTPYEWNNISILDTPGIKTGLRIDHDAITEQAIKESDLIVFVITNELFDNTLLNYFRKLAYDMGKAKQMILVVNKMARGGDSNIAYKDLDAMLSQPYGNYKMHPVDIFHPCFIDAASYLEAQEESNEEDKKELEDISNAKSFQETLDNFAEEMGAWGRAISPLQQIQKIISDVLSSLEDDSEGQANYDPDTINLYIHELKSAKSEALGNIDQNFADAARNIEGIGGNFVSSIDDFSKKEDLDDALDGVKRSIKDELETLKKNITPEIERVTTLIESKPNMDDNLFSTDNFNEKIVENIDGQTLENMVSFVAKLGPNAIAKGIGEFIYRDKLFFKGSAISGFAAKASPFIGMALEVLQKGIAEKKRSDLAKAKREMRQEFETMANELKDDGKKQVIDPLTQAIDMVISDKEKELKDIEAQYTAYNQQTEEVKEKLQQLNGECVDLLNSLQPAE